MPEIQQLGYLVFKVSNMNAWESLLVDTLGLQLSEKNENGLAFRIDEYQKRILLEEGSDDDIYAVGWQLDDEQHLAQFIQHLDNNNIATRKADDAFAQQRGVSQVYIATDPNGVQLEFCCGQQKATTLFNSKQLVSRFFAGEKGLGHLLLAARSKEETHNFYQKILGMKVSDYIREEIAPGIVIDATFMHVNQRHHSLAFAPMPPGKKVHHVFMEVENMDDVGFAYDRCLNAGFAMEMGMGKHANDQMFSFYMSTPSGFAIEIGYGGILLDVDNWQVKEYAHLSAWGHRRAG